MGKSLKGETLKDFSNSTRQLFSFKAKGLRFRFLALEFGKDGFRFNFLSCDLDEVEVEKTKDPRPPFNRHQNQVVFQGNCAYYHKVLIFLIISFGMKSSGLLDWMEANWSWLEIMTLVAMEVFRSR